MYLIIRHSSVIPKSFSPLSLVTYEKASAIFGLRKGTFGRTILNLCGWHVFEDADCACWTWNTATKIVSMLSNDRLQGRGYWGAHGVPHDFWVTHSSWATGFTLFNNPPFPSPGSASGVRLSCLRKMPFSSGCFPDPSFLKALRSLPKAQRMYLSKGLDSVEVNSHLLLYQWGTNQDNTTLGAGQRRICQIMWLTKVASNSGSC